MGPQDSSDGKAGEDPGGAADGAGGKAAPAATAPSRGASPAPSAGEDSDAPPTTAAMLPDGPSIFDSRQPEDDELENAFLQKKYVQQAKARGPNQHDGFSK